MSHPRELRAPTIGLIGFLTLVDLFATQAILPSLATRYGVAPGAIGVAVNASTIGMAIAGLLVGVLAAGVDRRRGIWLSLLLLSIPTTLLAFAPDLRVFAALRVLQGLCMATAFTLTLAYLAEKCTSVATASALAAYVTGVVASNLVGRLIAASVVSTAGTAANFFVFAALNLIGAALSARALSRSELAMAPATGHFWNAWARHLRNPALLRCFLIGFLILFAFIGVFTYVGFVLMRPPLALGMGQLGLVFLCFAPSMITTPIAGTFANRFGAGFTIAGSLVIAAIGLVPLLLPDVAAVFVGLVVVAAGTFFAQAVATGQVGRSADGERAAASGLYLAFYYSGGLAGAALVGQLFDRLGWSAALAGIALALLIAALLGRSIDARK
jgi:predicted MFS family arabinose efflux permease